MPLERRRRADKIGEGRVGEGGGILGGGRGKNLGQGLQGHCVDRDLHEARDQNWLGRDVAGEPMHADDVGDCGGHVAVGGRPPGGQGEQPGGLPHRR